MDVKNDVWFIRKSCELRGVFSKCEVYCHLNFVLHEAPTIDAISCDDVVPEVAVYRIYYVGFTTAA